MNYRIEIAPEAQNEIRALSGYVRAQALELFHNLSANPHLPRAKELRDIPNVYRIWLATKWRIVYEVDDELKAILILRVRRKEQIDYESL